MSDNKTPEQYLRRAKPPKSSLFEASINAASILVTAAAAAGVVAGIGKLAEINRNNRLAEIGIPVRGTDGKAFNSVAEENDIWAGRGQVLARDEK